MVIGKQQIVLGGVLIAAVIAAVVVFHRGEAKPLGATGRAADVERAIRSELTGKALCGFCLEPEAALHKIGDISVKDLGGDIYQAAIACECKAAENGKSRTKVLSREYAFVQGQATCTMPCLGWKDPETK